MPRPWDDIDELELATLSWVHWFNEHRLHSHCDDVPPAEFEAAFYADQQPPQPGMETKPEPPSNPGRFNVESPWVSWRLSCAPA